MDEALIEKVRLNEIIYNHKLPTYRDKTIKYAVWDRIGKELEMTGGKAKARWDTLRRCYSNARNRRRDNDCKQAWRYEKQMSFLLPFIQDRMSKGFASASTFVNMPLNSEECTVEGYSDDTTDETTNIKIERERNFDAEPERVFEQNDGIAFGVTDNLNDSENSEQDNDDTNFQAHCAQEKQRTELLNGLCEMEMTHLTKKPKHYHSNANFNDSAIFEAFDHTDLFFLSMSKMTKQLSKADQAKIKFELSKMVLSAEMKYYGSET